MSHAVHFRDAAGAIQLEDVPSLEGALERVERLRNDEGALEIRVFREVPIEVRTYYKVVAAEAPDSGVEASAGAVGGRDGTEPVVAEVAADPAPPVPAEPPSGAMVMSRPIAVANEPVADEAEESPAASDHRRQLFSRS